MEVPQWLNWLLSTIRSIRTILSRLPVSLWLQLWIHMQPYSYFCAAGSMLDDSVYMATLSTFRKGILIGGVEGGGGKPRLHCGESFLLRPPNLHPTLSFLYLIQERPSEERSSGYSDICEEVMPTLIFYFYFLKSRSHGGHVLSSWWSVFCKEPFLFSPIHPFIHLSSYYS